MTQPAEIWKVIEGFPNYHISNKGRVKSWKKEDYLIMKAVESSYGYLNIGLFKNNTGYHKKIHILVLEAFIGKCPNGYQTNHKDGNKLNNDLTNLEWITPSGNMKHAYKIGLHQSWQTQGEQSANAKLKDSEVWLIKQYLWFKMSQTKIAKIFNVHCATIHLISKGYTWSHIKFIPTDKDQKHYKKVLT